MIRGLQRGAHPCFADLLRTLRLGTAARTGVAGTICMKVLDGRTYEITGRSFLEARERLLS